MPKVAPYLFLVFVLFSSTAIAQKQETYVTRDSNYFYKVVLDSISPQYMEWHAKNVYVINRKDTTKVQTIELDLDFAYFGKDDLIIEDMNFDGHNDFRVRQHPIGQGGNASCVYFFYNPKLKLFVLDTTYADITSPDFDHHDKTVTEVVYCSPGGYSNTTYKVIKGKLVPISFRSGGNEYVESTHTNLFSEASGIYINGKRVTVDENKTIYDEEKQVYINTVWKRINGKLKLLHRSVSKEKPED